MSGTADQRTMRLSPRGVVVAALYRFAPEKSVQDTLKAADELLRSLDEHGYRVGPNA